VNNTEQSMSCTRTQTTHITKIHVDCTAAVNPMITQAHEQE